MGIFGKKEKTPEKELLDDIWYETNLALASDRERIELNKIVKNSYKSGASCDEIRRVYMENLPLYRYKSDSVYPGLYEVSVDGLRFMAPHRYSEFQGSLENDYYTCNKYEHLVRDEDGVSAVSTLSIYVFKGLNMEQALSTLAIDKNREVVRNITFGAYTGIAVYRTDLLKNKIAECFIFEKEGKTVAISTTNELDFKVYMEKIANGWYTAAQ